MLRCSGSSHHVAAPRPPSASVRAKAREPSRPLEGAGLAGASQTPEKLLGALPAHLGSVPRDLGGFFLELFPLCGRDGFVPRGN